MHTGAVELLKDAVDVGLDPPREIVPVRPIDAVGESLDLEVVLDIHCHGVNNGHGIPHWRSGRLTALFPLPARAI